MTKLCPDSKADSITCAPNTFDNPTSSGDQIAPASRKYNENHQKFVFSNPAAKYVGSREPGTKRLAKITGTPRRVNHAELFSTSSARMNHFSGARRSAGLPRYLPAKKSRTSPTNMPRKQANAPSRKTDSPLRNHHACAYASQVFAHKRRNGDKRYHYDHAAGFRRQHHCSGAYIQVRCAGEIKQHKDCDNDPFSLRHRALNYG